MAVNKADCTAADIVSVCVEVSFCLRQMCFNTFSNIVHGNLLSQQQQLWGWPTIPYNRTN